MKCITVIRTQSFYYSILLYILYVYNKIIRSIQYSICIYILFCIIINKVVLSTLVLEAFNIIVLLILRSIIILLFITSKYITIA